MGLYICLVHCNGSCYVLYCFVLLSKTVSSMDFAVLGLCVLRVCGLIDLFAYVDVQN